MNPVDLLPLLHKNNIYVDTKGDIIIVYTRDVEYRLYYKGDDGLYSGCMKPLYATGELFCKDIDVQKMIEEDILRHN